MKNNLCRNEILEVGAVINAYTNYDWTGGFLGNARLKGYHMDESVEYQTWIVDYLDGNINSIYCTKHPLPIKHVIDNHK